MQRLGLTAAQQLDQPTDQIQRLPSLRLLSEAACGAVPQTGPKTQSEAANQAVSVVEFEALAEGTKHLSWGLTLTAKHGS